MILLQSFYFIAYVFTSWNNRLRCSRSALPKLRLYFNAMRLNSSARFLILWFLLLRTVVQFSLCRVSKNFSIYLWSITYPQQVYSPGGSIPLIYCLWRYCSERWPGLFSFLYQLHNRLSINVVVFPVPVDHVRWRYLHWRKYRLDCSLLTFI